MALYLSSKVYDYVCCMLYVIFDALGMWKIAIPKVIAGSLLKAFTFSRSLISSQSTLRSVICLHTSDTLNILQPTTCHVEIFSLQIIKNLIQILFNMTGQGRRLYRTGNKKNPDKQDRQMFRPSCFSC